MRRCLLLFAVALIVLIPLSLVQGQREFGFDNSKPSGQPYLSPQESVKRLKVPPGWEVKVFAAEPDVINPIAFTIDERGRLWVVENFEYPKRTAKGKKPRDRIKIFEDTDGDGVADKVSTWAAGKDLPIGWDLATGIEVGHGGAFLGAPPYLFFLQDTKGTSKCDKQEILLKGFGSQDTHETLNTFQWGPDSKLYGLHGVFTHSQVDGVKLNAAVWRFDAQRWRSGLVGNFDIFAEGTSNPWGMDFDQHGQCFLAACVIPHLYHMVPGGTYKRQAGGSFNPYAFGLLNEICDHTHHKHSGWAHAGLLVMDGDHVPEPYRGSLLMGSIHGCSINRDVLRPNGSTYIGSHAPDFLVSGDKNFRPINMRWGPDGSIFVIDWHDQNPCHQAAPDSWDQTHGRIYKIQRKGLRSSPPVDLGKQSSRELVGQLTNDNPYWYRTALRLLSERKDKSVAHLLRDLAFTSKVERHALRGLWGVYAVGAFNFDAAQRGLNHTSPWMRSWTIRLLGEAGTVDKELLPVLTEMAEKDGAPQVRLQLASTARRLTKQDALPLLQNLMKHKEDAKDPVIPLMIWLAYEPRLASQPKPALDWLKENAPGNALVTNHIVSRAMRRLAAGSKAQDLASCVAFVGEATDTGVRRQALEGLVEALKNRQVDEPASWKKVFARLNNDADAQIQKLARRLAVHFQDREAVARSLTLASDANKPVADRIHAIHDLALAHPAEGLKVLQALVVAKENAEIRIEACRALASYDQLEVAPKVLSGWKTYPPALRAEATLVLSGRKTWARELLLAVGKKHVPRTDVTNNVILRILAFGDKKLNHQIEAVWGRFRDTPTELNELINKMRGQLYQARASFDRGKVVFDNQCAKCHKFDGRGSEVGPNLDGAARDIEYLLINVLDPNRVVGQPYYMRTVALKNGRLETGILVSENDDSISLKSENDVVKVILRKDIDGKIKTQEKSIMPEGLANNMTAQDFRDLIRYTMAHPFLSEVKVAGPWPNKVGQSKQVLEWERPVVGAPGRIPLPAAGKAGDQVTLVAAEVTAPSGLRTRLQIGAVHALKVSLNGKEVYRGKPGSGHAAPDQVGIDIELQKGVNRLLFEVTYQGDNEVIYARLLDPERRLRYAETGK